MDYLLYPLTEMAELCDLILSSCQATKSVPDLQILDCRSHVALSGYLGIASGTQVLLGLNGTNNGQLVWDQQLDSVGVSISMDSDQEGDQGDSQ